MLYSLLRINAVSLDQDSIDTFR